MENTTSLEVHPASHPRLDVHRAGFALDHAYLEQCWAPVLGPSSVLLLRRMTALWRDSTPATVELGELGAQLGLGHGESRHSPIARTVDRVVRFRFAAWAAPGVLDVYTEVPPLSQRQLERVPQWCAERHEQLLGRHLAELGRVPGPMGPPAAPPFQLAAPADAMSQRLDQLAVTRMNPVDTGLSR